MKLVHGERAGKKLPEYEKLKAPMVEKYAELAAMGLPLFAGRAT